MPSDTPRLPKGPKPHKFEVSTSPNVPTPTCKHCGLHQDDSIHAAPADNPPGDPDDGL